MLYLFGLLVLWWLAPLLAVAVLPNVPVRHKVKAMQSLFWAYTKSLCVVPFALTAPLVVPVALLFTPRSAENLTGIFWPWGNDVSINGDKPELTEAYYAPGHDTRSYYARFVWLVLRNRASRFAQYMGHVWQPGEYVDAEHWGDSQVGRNHEGWVLNRRGPFYQLYMVKKLGKLCLRTNCGHKLWSGEGDKRSNTMVVSITASLLSWKGD